MRKYVYFAVGVDTTSILNSKPGCDIRTQKSFDSLFTTFVEGLAVDKKRTGFIGRCEILADDRLDDIEYVTGGAYGTNIIDCFNIRFYKQKNNKFNASLIFAENGKENLINICKKIDEFYSPKKKIKPMEMPESILNNVMNLIEEDSGSEIKDTQFFIQTIKFELENGDICLVRRDEETLSSDYKFFSENYWFKNKERIMEQYESCYWKAN